MGNTPQIDVVTQHLAHSHLENTIGCIDQMNPFHKISPATLKEMPQLLKSTGIFYEMFLNLFDDTVIINTQAISCVG